MTRIDFIKDTVVKIRIDFITQLTNFGHIAIEGNPLMRTFKMKIMHFFGFCKDNYQKYVQSLYAVYAITQIPQAEE